MASPPRPGGKGRLVAGYALLRCFASRLMTRQVQLLLEADRSSFASPMPTGGKRGIEGQTYRRQGAGAGRAGAGAGCADDHLMRRMWLVVQQASGYMALPRLGQLAARAPRDCLPRFACHMAMHASTRSSNAWRSSACAATHPPSRVQHMPGMRGSATHGSAACSLLLPGKILMCSGG